MINIQIGFQDFLTQEAFCLLQTKFLWNDYNFDDDYSMRIKTVQKELKINFFNKVSLEHSGEIINLDYYSDFLLPEINNLSIKYFNTYLKKAQGLYTLDDRKGLAKQYQDRLNFWHDMITKNNTLVSAVKVVLKMQIDDLNDKILKHQSNPYPNIKEKIEFNWNLADVTCFFNQLRNKKQIAHISDADLGRIIDTVFKYKSTGKYNDINGSRKLLNNYKNDDRNSDKSLTRLKTVFSSFFDEDSVAT